MMDSLSLMTVGLVSRLSVIGALHVVPPWAFVDRLTRTALSRFAVSLNDREIWWAVPAGEKLTHGSDARS